MSQEDLVPSLVLILLLLVLTENLLTTLGLPLHHPLLPRPLHVYFLWPASLPPLPQLERLGVRKNFYPLFLIGEGELMAAVLALEALAAVAVELPSSRSSMSQQLLRISR